MMNRTFIATICSTLLIVIALPWLVQGQMGGGFGGTGRGGMGGMGSGGMSGAAAGGEGMGMGGMGAGQFYISEIPADQIVQWQPPQGPPPSWLVSGREAVRVEEQLRAQLAREDIVKLEGLALTELPAMFADSFGIDLVIDQRAMEDQGLEARNISLSVATSGRIRDIFRRVLDPHQLTYIVRESYVEITTMDDASANPVNRYYDLGNVMANNRWLPALVNAMQTGIEPESWVNNNSGGAGIIVPVGQVLVVSTTEQNHLEIEKMLANFAERLNSNEAGGQPSVGVGGGGMF
jgi:hypothetical protein